MTRINCVPPSELCRQHLVAEYRELPRIFKVAQRAIKAGGFRPKDELPDYRLGDGHLRFFFTRLDWCAGRHSELVAEMRQRGYAPTIERPDSFWRGLIPRDFWQGWTPTPEALAINRARLLERMPR